MQQNEQKNLLEVMSSESGEKVLQFLMRRLDLPQSLLHRWIRTGQIRINGGRIKPFNHVKAGDLLRLPPFALNVKNVNSKNEDQEYLAKHDKNLPLPPIVFKDEHLTIYNKPRGMPVHAGTGHSDCLASRLKEHFKDIIYKPNPAHRLDKDTSGLICVAFSYAALRALQDSFALNSINKEYLTWVHGHWTHDQPILLEHYMSKKYMGTEEKMRILSPDDGKKALCIAHCLKRIDNFSLMHIRLITGRTHQIRLQMSAQGHAVLGDGKYGESEPNSKLYLHSMRITLPNNQAFDALNLSGKSFCALPFWENEFSITTMPNTLALSDL